MKRFTRLFAVLCMGLVAAWGLSAWHAPKVSAYYSLNHNDDGQGNGDDGHYHDGDDGCQDKDGDHHDGDYNGGHQGNDDGDDGHDHDGQGHLVGSFLVTISNYASGGVTQRAVITLHRDHTMSVISSNQNSGQISSQLGAWKHGCSGSTGRTIQFSFGDGTINRLDFTFNAHQPKGTISGTITITNFPGNGNPLGTGGTVIGNCDFTGTRIEAPKPSDNDNDNNDDD